MSDDTGKVTNNETANRFEMPTKGGLAYLEYRIVGDAWMLTHTEVPEASEGQGEGSRLVRAVLDEARQKELRVIPMCPFVVAFMQRHPEYVTLVHPAQRGALGL